MRPQHLMALWQVEVRKLLARMSGRVGLVACVLLALAMPVLLQSCDGSEVMLNGAMLGDQYDGTAPEAVSWTLWMRNFFVLRTFIVVLAAVSVAGEFQDRTLREDLVHPVPRWSVLAAKWAALCTWTVIGAALSWTVAAVLGGILFGAGGDWKSATIAWAVTLLCDFGFAALAMCVAVLLRSVVGTVAGVIGFMIFDTFLGWALTVLTWVGQMAEIPWALELAIQARPWLPSSAFGAWVSWTSWAGAEPWAWQHFGALGAITALSMGLAIAVFSRVDIP